MKIIRKIGRILLWIVGAFLALDLLVVGLFFIKPVQNAAVDFATEKVSALWNCELTIGEIYLTPTLDVRIYDACLRDYRNNDMIRIGMCETGLLHLQLTPTELYFGSFFVDDAEVVVRKYQGDEKVNIALWAENFKKKKKTKKLFVMHCDRLRLSHSEFRYVNDDRRRPDEKYAAGTDIDYGYFQLQNLELDCKDFLVRSDDISAEISKLACTQYTGFRILNSSGRFRINSENIIYKNACIITPNSRLFLDFAMRYHKWQFADFVNTVAFDARVKPSSLGLTDVTFFAPKAKGLSDRLVLCGNVVGPVNELKSRDLYVSVGKSTFLEGDFALDNVTDIANVKMDLDFRKSRINMADVAAFALPQGKVLTLPDELKTLNDNELYGTFTGTLDDFTTDLSLNTAAGNVVLTLDATSDESKMMDCSGTVAVQQVDVGRILNTNAIGPVALTATFKGSFASPVRRNDFLETADVALHTYVSRAFVENYPLSDVTLDAQYKKKHCDVQVLSMDENARFMAQGFADFAGALPQYQCNLNLDKLSAGAILGSMATADSLSAKGFDKFVLFAQHHPDMSLSIGKMKLNVVGDNLNDLSAIVLLDTVAYTQDRQVLYSDGMRFVAVASENTHKYRLTSDIVNASLTTNYKLDRLVDTLYSVAYGYFPNVLEKRPAKDGSEGWETVASADDGFVSLSLETFRINRFLSFFAPDIRIAPKTELYVCQSSDTLKDILYLNSDFFELRDKFRVYNLNARAREKGLNRISLTLSTDSLAILNSKKGFVFTDLELKTSVKQNQVDYDFNWMNPSVISSHPSWLAGSLQVLSPQHLTNHFNESRIYVKDYLWQFSDSNSISYRHGDIVVENLGFFSQQSTIKVDGEYSKKNNAPLVADLDNVDLSMLNSFIGSESVKLGGAMTGALNLMKKNGVDMLAGKVLVNDFEFNNTLFGDVCLFAMMPSAESFGFAGGIFKDGGIPVQTFDDYTFDNFKSDIARGVQRVMLTGGYTPKTKEFLVKANIDSLDLDFLSPFLSSFSHQVAGNAFGEVSFIAKPDSVYFSGSATVRRGELGIKALNTVYSLDNQTIHFTKEGFELRDVKAKDKFGNEASVKGYIHHRRFKNMTMNLSISTDRILAMNLPKTPDQIFFGDGFVGGDVSITMDQQGLKFFSDNLVTQKGTNFILPVYFSETTSESAEISFKQPVQQENEVEVANSMDLDFDMNFMVTPDAIVQLELDPSIGGLMQARVEGPLRLIYNATSGLTLNGGLTIQSGSFHLTLKDIIDKMLTLRPGGTINFLGPLDNATVNVSGIYKTTASLNEIIQGGMSGESNMRRTPVNAYLNLSGSLFNPVIDFSFELPNSTNDVTNMFFGSLDTTSAANRTQQFFSLLVLGKFQADNEISGNAISSAMEYTGLELLTNTINNFISKNLKYVNLGINYRNADDTHAAEYSVSASTSLYNDRIVIEGSFGYANDKNKIYNNGNNFIGDYSIEYALNEQKNWRVKVFNVTNQYSSLTQTSPYAQGVALIYKQEFNNKQDWKESWKRTKKTEKTSSKKKSKQSKQK